MQNARVRVQRSDEFRCERGGPVTRVLAFRSLLAFQGFRVRGARPLHYNPWMHAASTANSNSVPGPGSTEHVACYPGSFDPATFGHLDVVVRGRKMFDRVVVGVGRNPEKETLFSQEERTDLLRRLVTDLIREQPEGAAVEVRPYEGLTVDFARSVGATVLLRGIRNLSDLQSEIQQALTNRQVAGLETAFVVAGESFAYTSSTLIRQIAAMGKDLTVLKSMCPPMVIDALQKKKREAPAKFGRLLE